MNTQEIKKDLTENALKFLTQSINEFDENLQFSVIHFFSSIELFFKARLLDEHWTLLYEKPEEAQSGNFLMGDFKSVTLSSSIKRLRNISQAGITQAEDQCFQKIRLHRNKALHFFHTFHRPDLASLKEEIISLQCQGWQFLYDLLLKKWDPHFSDFRERVYECHHLMLGQRKYLTKKFELKKSEIEFAKTSGIEVNVCRICGFQSSLLREILGPLFQGDCIVCEKCVTLITVTCPRCSGKIYSYEMGEGVCGSCSEKVDLAYMKEHLDEDCTSLSDLAAGEGGAAYCSLCEFREECVIEIQEEYLCLNCHTIFKDFYRCGSCYSRVSGEDDFSVMNGCPGCFY